MIKNEFALRLSSTRLVSPIEYPILKFVDVQREIGASAQANEEFFVRLDVIEGKNKFDHLVISALDGDIMIYGFIDHETCSLTNPNWQSEILSNIAYKSNHGNELPVIWRGGYSWSALTFTRSVDLIMSIFKEFFETGKITHPWMSD